MFTCNKSTIKSYKYNNSTTWPLSLIGKLILYRLKINYTPVFTSADAWVLELMDTTHKNIKLGRLA